MDGFVDSEGNALDFIADETAGVEETVIHSMMLDRLNAALLLLSDNEQALIRARITPKGVDELIIEQERSELLHRIIATLP